MDTALMETPCFSGLGYTLCISRIPTAQALLPYLCRKTTGGRIKDIEFH
jgi:hypothetical protein